MPETTLERFGLAGLARVTQASLDWRKWPVGSRWGERDRTAPSKDALDKIIEAEIIPRLMLMHRDQSQSSFVTDLPAPSNRFSDDEIKAFAMRAVECDAETLVERVRAFMADGVSHEDILLNLLAPAARQLGEQWEEDTRDFADVTIGLMKLHRVLDTLSADTPPDLGEGGSAPRILLAPAPGEQHLFGVVMVGEIFARCGWNVRCESAPDIQLLTEAVGATHFDVFGLSASAEIHTKDLRALVRGVKAASLNSEIAVLTGGPAFTSDAGLSKRIGADANASDGVRAVVTAERLIHRLARAGRAQ